MMRVCMLPLPTFLTMGACCLRACIVLMSHCRRSSHRDGDSGRRGLSVFLLGKYLFWKYCRLPFIPNMSCEIAPMAYLGKRNTGSRRMSFLGWRVCERFAAMSPPMECPIMRSMVLFCVRVSICSLQLWTLYVVSLGDLPCPVRSGAMMV